jgi:hypothetical protein
MQCPDPAVKEINYQQRSAFGPQQHVRKIQSKQPNLRRSGIVKKS